MAKDKTPEILIHVVEEKLSDNSVVFNVDFCGQKLAAIDADAAEALADGIAALINEYTVHTAGTVIA